MEEKQTEERVLPTGAESGGRKPGESRSRQDAPARPEGGSEDPPVAGRARGEPRLRGFGRPPLPLGDRAASRAAAAAEIAF